MLRTLKELSSHRAETVRSDRLKYDMNRNAARDMLQDAFKAYMYQRDAIADMRIILAENQTADENNETSNYFGRYAHKQARI